MVLDKESFKNYRLEDVRASDKSRVFTLRLNIEELKNLEEAGRIIGQDQLGTVIKQLMSVGLNVLHEPKTTHLIEVLFKNKRNNERRGVAITNPTFSQM